MTHPARRLAADPLGMPRIPNACHSQDGTCVVAGNVRRCLPEGTRVHTTRGAVRIEDITVGDQVETAAGSSPLTAVVDQGLQDTVYIDHEFGEFECTANHQVAVFDSLHTWTFKRADELTGGDHLVWDPTVITGTETSLPASTEPAMRRVDPNHRHGTRTPSGRKNGICKVRGCGAPEDAAGLCNAHYIRKRKYGDPLVMAARTAGFTVPNLDGDTAWLIGLLHGDGHVYVRDDGKVGQVSIAFDPNYSEVIAKARKAFTRFGITHLNEVGPSDDDGSLKLRACRVAFARWVVANIKQASTPIEIPEWIFQATADVRAGYLAGIFDADGSDRTRPLVLAATIYQSYAHQLVQLAATLGIAAEVKTNRRDHPKGWSDLFHVSVVGAENVTRFNGWIGLRSGKRDGAPTLARSMRFAFAHDFGVAHGLRSSYGNGRSRYTTAVVERMTGVKASVYPVEVHGVRPARAAIPTRDIEVAGIHQFTAEGFVVHNSSEILR